MSVAFDECFNTENILVFFLLDKIPLPKTVTSRCQHQSQPLHLDCFFVQDVSIRIQTSGTLGVDTDWLNS
jgi:hypothetical protein